MKTTAKKSPAQRPRKAPAKPVQGGSPGEFGRLTNAEKRTLVLIAKDAFHFQDRMGNIDPGLTFDAWRRDQVKDNFGVDGTSKLIRNQWKKAAAMFFRLQGREDKALELLLATGAKTDTGDQTDTHESSEEVVALIRQALDNHAQVPAESLVDPRGHIHPGWFLKAARQRTGKRTLTMETLSSRLDRDTLFGLFSHLTSHINLREGRDNQDRRQPRRYPEKPDPGTMHEDEPF